MSAVLYRFQQGVAALQAAPPHDREAILAATLTAEQADAFRGLSRHDQAHLCRVYRALVASGETDPDLLTAALLHDLGKATTEGRVGLPHRVLRVLIGGIAPRFLDRIAQLPAPRWRVGIALAVHHPRLGAERAAQLGCSPRVCWLIAHHEDDPPPPDADLRRLIAADQTVH